MKIIQISPVTTPCWAVFGDEEGCYVDPIRMFALCEMPDTKIITDIHPVTDSFFEDGAIDCDYMAIVYIDLNLEENASEKQAFDKRAIRRQENRTKARARP